MKKTILFLVLLFAFLQVAIAQDNYYKDTVWTNKIPDQSMGFWKVKFSLTDSLIVAHGYKYDLFIDTKQVGKSTG
jgi:hypothetical protein